MLELYSALSGLEVEQRRKRIPELIDLVGLTGWADVRIKKYSKGMLQRLGLAQALIHKPRLLVLDEPTDGVDPVGRRDIRDILNRLTGTGVTVFINSHLLSEVEAFCEYVAILRTGSVALEGKIANLISGSGYTISAVNVPAALLEDFRRRGISYAQTENGLSFSAGSLEETNSVIDRIRAAGALVETVSQSSSTLEDVFIRATQVSNAA
jgi:ABC-2 type transport system ATP-binding protein